VCAQNNQWSLELGDDLSQSPFELAVAACKGVVMILDGGAVALTRIWCLVSHLLTVLALLRLSCCCRVQYEVLRAHSLQLKFHIATHNGVLTAVDTEEDAYKAGPALKADLMTLMRKLLVLDVETAQCSVEADRVKILGAVQVAVGIPQLTIVIQALLADAGHKMMVYTGTGLDLLARVASLKGQAACVAWSGRTALHVAAQESAAAVEHCLRDSQADLEARDSTGATPLLLAARWPGIEAKSHPPCLRHHTVLLTYTDILPAFTILTLNQVVYL